MSFKKEYLNYLRHLSDKKLSLTKKYNGEGRRNVTNHRGISGINLKHKSLCFTPIAEKFEGSFFYDIDGNKYLDISMGFGVHLFGHNPKFINENISKKNKSSWGLGPYSSEMVQFAEGVKKLTNTERLSFFNSGSESIMVAIRIARAYTKKNKIVIFKDSYHGHNDATLVFKTDPMSGQPLPLIPGIPQSSQEDTLLLDFNSDNSLQFIEEHAHEIAAVLIEPVQSRNPGLHAKSFLKKLRIISTTYNIAFVFDEMITGFRIHPGGAQAFFDLEADIVTYGKAIGGGMPIGIVAGKAKYMDMIDGGQWNYKDTSLPKSRRTFVAGTFCAHPLTISAGNAIVEVLLERGDELIKKLNAKTERFVGEINEWMRSNDFPISISNFGSLFRINVPSSAKLYFHHLLFEGIYIWEGKTSFLSIAHSENDVNFLKSKLKKCASVMRAFGYFPKLVINEKNDSGKPLTSTLNNHNNRFDISLNIGVGIKIINGDFEIDLLEIAFRYVCIEESKLNATSLIDCLSKAEFKNEEDENKLLQEFIDQNIERKGIGFLFLLKNNKLTSFALAGHKSLVDGWSLSIILERILVVYDSLIKGKLLPEYSQNQTPKKQELQEVEIIKQKVYDAKKISYWSNMKYSSLKRKARSLRITTLQLIKASFLFAFIKSFELNKLSMTIGSPVASQIKSGNLDLIGPYTYLENEKYIMNSSNNLIDILKSKNSYLEEDIDCVINLDRMVFSFDKPGLKLTPKPLDPSFIRYPMVVNIFCHKDGSLWIDFKWDKERYLEGQINNLIENFNLVISEENGFA